MKRIFFWAVFLGITASGYADAQSDLFEEARKGNLENLEKAHSIAPDSFDNTDSRGRSVVFYAIESGNVNVLKFVLDRNNRIDVPDNSGEYPIHYAAKNPDSRIIDLVLNRDSYLNYLTRNGENALDIASYYGNHSVVAYLTAKGMKYSKPVSGPYTIGLYFGYLIISILMTIWVARTLFNNGRIFLVKMFNGEEKLADSINHLLIVGFYLINIGYISLSLTSSQKPIDLAECIEVLTTKVGIVLLILGAMHFFNLFLFAKFRKRISHTFGEAEVHA